MVSHGRGIATEAGQVVIDYGFTIIRRHRIEAYTIADNARSARLLRRLGFALEGVHRKCFLERDGMFHHSARDGLLTTAGR